MNIGRQSAPDRSQRKQDHANRIDFLATEKITERAAEQQEGGEKERVGFNHPLYIRDRCVEICLQRGQRYVNDCAVDEYHARAENCRGEGPPALHLSARCCGRRLPGINKAFVARRLEQMHLGEQLTPVFGVRRLVAALESADESAHSKKSNAARFHERRPFLFAFTNGSVMLFLVPDRHTETTAVVAVVVVIDHQI